MIPLAVGAVVITGVPLPTVSVKEAGELAPPPLVAVRERLKVPTAVGVPLITPELLTVAHDGKPDTAYDVGLLFAVIW